jgi:hypothetical protein
MTITIELSDNQAAVLREKAAAQGLSVEKWCQSLIQQQTQSSVRSVVDEMRALRARIKPDPEGWTTRDYVNYGRRSS